jgi:dTDP-4-amino-4,6-dideoxygalactose transaminase
MSMHIPYNKPFIVGKELYYIAQAVLQHGHLAGDGSFTKLCNKWLEQELTCHKVLLTNSCTAALEMSALLCDIQPGDEVILPSFTFVSTANAFVLRGAVPVFVDIREDTLNMDERLLESVITNKTKAIVPVHYAGRGCAMREILGLAGANGLAVIEDAAQALMSSYEGKKLGTFGALGCLSFHETKNVISGEGGALLINDERMMERAEIIWEKGTNRKKFFRGQVDKYTWVDVGSSFLPSELMAAFLYSQLEHAAEIISKRRLLFNTYRTGLQQLETAGLITMPMDSTDDQINGHIFHILARNNRERDALLSFLKERDIFAVFHYIPLHSSPAGLKYGRAGTTMEVTNDISSRMIRLPLYYEMTEHDQQEVITTLYAFFDDV